VNFPTHIDQAIFDHQNALRAEARARRVARSARANRRAQRRSAMATPPVSKPRRSALSELLMDLGLAAEAAMSDGRSARALVRATKALAVPAAAFGLEPVPAGTPAVVSLRWLSRLAERTAGQNVTIEATQLEALAAVVEELRSVAPDEGAPVQVTVGAKAWVRWRPAATFAPAGLDRC
jgi:hypothetical protein